MAYGDLKGKTAGKRLSVAFDRARLMEELAAEQDSNIEVGDFLSDLATAIKFRMKSGLAQGDWIEEPERFLTDGLVWGREEASASGVKLQITLSLDTSTSMWGNRIMKHAGPAVLAFDRIIRKASADLPVGSVLYAPFIFHGTAHQVPPQYLNAFVGRSQWADGSDAGVVWPTYPHLDAFKAAKDAKALPADAKIDAYKLSGEDTKIAPLFQAIKDWEEKDGDTNAVRLDIVLTDGFLEDPKDVEEATAIQEKRNGRLRTVLLNFLSLDQWSNYQLPDRCAQFPVEPQNLDKSVRDILNEAVADLFT